MKLIFLDVDGVLNSVRSMVAFHEELKQAWNTQSSKDYDDSQHLLRNHIDPIAIRLLNRVTNATGAKYVISSTHRKHVRTLEQLKKYFAGFGLTGEVIGSTPISDNGHRGTEIQEYFGKATIPGEVTHYVIIDDDSDMLDYQKKFNFVHTSGQEGFSYENYKQTMSILSSKEAL